MALKAILLTAAAAGMGLSMVQRARAARKVTVSGAPIRDPEIGASARMAARSTGSQAASPLAESPNLAERLEDTLETSVVGDGGAGDDDLFGSNAQRGETPRVTGLPDLTRGA